MKHSGNLGKMKTANAESVQYDLVLQDGTIRMNDLLGKKIKLSFTGQINCRICQKGIKKVFGQGMCYTCFVGSPQNSDCVLRPELCKGHLGEGRSVDWEKANHVQPHVVYLALTSGVKVGVTREANIPHRWIDQGAWKVIRFCEVPYRRLAGDIEVFMKEFVTDKTHWQNMLKDVRMDDVDLVEEKESLLDELKEEFGQYYSKNNEIVEFKYPVLEYPTKVTSLSFDKTPVIQGKLAGIRGQYLILEGGKVVNVRRFSGYGIDFEA